MCWPLASSARYSKYTVSFFTTAAGLNVACSSHRTMVSPMEERNGDAGLGVIAGFTALGFSKGPNVHAGACAQAGCPVTEPGADKHITRTVALPVTRIVPTRPSARGGRQVRHRRDQRAHLRLVGRRPLPLTVHHELGAPLGITVQLRRQLSERVAARLSRQFLGAGQGAP